MMTAQLIDFLIALGAFFPVFAGLFGWWLLR